MSDTKSLTTGQKVEAVLSEIDSQELQDEIRNTFYLSNPLELARLLHARDLRNETRGALLRIRVEMPPAYNGENLVPLLEKACERHFQTMIANLKAVSAIDGTPGVL